MQTPTALCSFPNSRPILLRRRSQKCVNESSMYAHWVGLYPSFPLNWVLGPFGHGGLQNVKTSEDPFGHDIIPLSTKMFAHALSQVMSFSAFYL